MWFQVSLLTLISNLPEQRWLLIAGCNLLVRFECCEFDRGQRPSNKTYCKDIGVTLVAQETILCSNGIKKEHLCLISSEL